jgi:hypothetical protein
VARKKANPKSIVAFKTALADFPSTDPAGDQGRVKRAGCAGRDPWPPVDRCERLAWPA